MTTSHTLYIISDLHIGGKYSDGSNDRGFRMNTQIDRLTECIKTISGQVRSSAGATELVINGDFVDFLAEEPSTGTWSAFIADPYVAEEVFEQIIARDRHLFSALRELLANGGQITILLGNHDVELSLPRVRRRLEAELGVTPGMPFRFIYDGEAYTVGQVLVEHGNRYDGWNVVQYGELAKIRGLQSRGLPHDDRIEFEVQLGSQLVAEVMNPLKKEFRFVDLLKPEDKAVIPLLLALRPQLRGQLGSLIARHRKAVQRSPIGGATVGRAEDMAGSEREQAIPPLALGLFGGVETTEGDGFLREQLNSVWGADKTTEFLTNLSPPDGGLSGDEMALREDVEHLLGLAELLALPEGWKRRRLRALRRALNVIGGLKPFDLKCPSSEEEPYVGAARALASAGGYELVIFGHTHLARDLDLFGADGKTRIGRYLNTGTWADLMAFPVENLQGPEEAAIEWLEAYLSKLRENAISAFQRPTFAFVTLDESGRVSAAEIREFTSSEVLKP